MNPVDFGKRYEKLPVSIFPDASDAAQKIAQRIKQAVEEKAAKNQMLVLALNSSSTLIQVYEELVNLHKHGLSYKNVVFFAMDEYYPLAPSALQSHYRMLKEYLFDLIDVRPEHTFYLNGDTPKEHIHDVCAQYDKNVESFGGLDIIVTSAMGMNEPGSPYNSGTRPITMNWSTRISSASEFFGVEYVPATAITMGIGTILNAKEIYYLAWGESKSKTINAIVEGPITDQNPASYLQQHGNAYILVDTAASQGLTRIKTPWLTQSCVWDDLLTRKAVYWLCQKLNKPILKLTARDYTDNGLNDLVTERGPFSKINIDTFNYLQHTITGWPGGKPNADDSTRPERKSPFPKRVVVFSPHPDDDVISMGGTVARLSEQGHDLHIAYQTAGDIAVFDFEALRYLDFMRRSASLFGIDKQKMDELYAKTEADLAKKRPGEPDTFQFREVKAAIRRGEAASACRYLNIPEDHVHFLDLPFYKTGGVKKKPISQADVDIVVKLLQEVQPHQIFAAGDLSDPHGTHRVCFQAVQKALEVLKDAPWMKDCRVWLYRGAWQEWDVIEADMAVPLSPEEVIIKHEAVFKHRSQMYRPLFPGSDPREFWERAEERNHNTALLYDKLGMAEYQAIELFVRYQ